MRILVVEDDSRVAGQVEGALRQAGYVVDVAHDGSEGHFLGDTEPYDAVVLDLGLPLLDGLSVLQRWRHDGRGMPVLILTARDTWREKVFGLRAGADDYLAKPFEMEEMLARVEALIRRAAGQSGAVIEWGAVKLDTVTQRVTLDGAAVDLTPLEYGMLSYMMHHGDKVLSKTELAEHIYGHDSDPDSNTIEVLVNRLRKKFGPTFIRTLRGRGYQLAPQEDAA